MAPALAPLLLSLAKATGGVLVLFLGWVTIERAWRRTFGVSDEERNTPEGCGTCTCTRRCATGRAGAASRTSASAHREG